jgi:hypothetical protein
MALEISSGSTHGIGSRFICRKPSLTSSRPGSLRSGRKARYSASFWIIGVSHAVGQTALTRMKCPASSHARVRVRDRTPDLAAL